MKRWRLFDAVMLAAIWGMIAGIGCGDVAAPAPSAGDDTGRVVTMPGGPETRRAAVTNPYGYFTGAVTPALTFPAHGQGGTPNNYHLITNMGQTSCYGISCSAMVGGVYSFYGDVYVLTAPTLLRPGLGTIGMAIPQCGGPGSCNPAVPMQWPYKPEEATAAPGQVAGDVASGIARIFQAKPTSGAAAGTYFQRTICGLFGCDGSWVVAMGAIAEFGNGCQAWLVQAAEPGYYDPYTEVNVPTDVDHYQWWVPPCGTHHVDPQWPDATTQYNGVAHLAITETNAGALGPPVVTDGLFACAGLVGFSPVHRLRLAPGDGHTYKGDTDGVRFCIAPPTTSYPALYNPTNVYMWLTREDGINVWVRPRTRVPNPPFSGDKPPNNQFTKMENWPSYVLRLGAPESASFQDDDGDVYGDQGVMVTEANGLPYALQFSLSYDNNQSGEGVINTYAWLSMNNLWSRGTLTYAVGP